MLKVKHIIFSIYLFMIAGTLSLQGQDVWFVDAGAGVVRYDLFDETYKYVLFDGVFFPDKMIIDPDHDRIYWTDWTKDKIRSANRDGSNVKDIVLGVDSPRGIAFDTVDQVLYWVEFISGNVRKSRIDGTMVETIETDLTNPDDITLDIAGQRLFIITADGIQMVKTDGSESELILDASGLASIEFDKVTGLIYYGNKSAGEIRRVDDQGQNIETIVTNAGHLNDGMFIDYNNQKLYWSDYTDKKIYKSNLNGSFKETVYTSLESGVSDIVIDPQGGMMYWAEPNISKIKRMTISGSEPENILDGKLWDQVSDISMSQLERKLFFIERMKQQIVSTNLEGENPTVLVDSIPGVVSLIYDPYGKDLYWSDRLDKVIYRSDANGNNRVPLITGVDCISMDIDYVTKTIYFIELTTNQIKYANLDNPVVQTLSLPEFTVPEDLAVQMETRHLYWIDGAQNDIYRTALPGLTHQLFINQGTNLSYLDATEGLSGVVFIDAGKIIFTDDVNIQAVDIEYPGQIFPHSVRVLEPVFVIDIKPDYEVFGEINCGIVDILIDPYGALAPITYTWSDGYVSQQPLRPGVPEGQYTVTITDVIQRNATLSVSWESEFEPLNVLVEITHATGSTLGAAECNIQGGLPPYEILWEGDGIEIENETMIDDLSPGDYTITVKDENDCITTHAFTIEMLNATASPLKNKVQLYPTLVYHELIVSVEGQVNKDLRYELFDGQARNKKSGMIQNSQPVDVSGLPPGIYWIKISLDDEVSMHSFIKITN